jgi:hypothetical protein
MAPLEKTVSQRSEVFTVATLSDRFGFANYEVAEVDGLWAENCPAG